MNTKQIKEQMAQYAVGNKYMADCCGVTDHYLRQCLSGSKPVTKALNKKISGVFNTLKITPKHLKEELKQPVLNVEPPKRKEPQLPVDIEYTDPMLTIKSVCEHLDNVYGNTNIEQYYYIHGNKKVCVTIDITQED